MNRRHFIAGAYAGLLSECMAANPLSGASVFRPGLVPLGHSTSPSYFCTWAVQNYIYGDGAKTLDISKLQGDSGAQLARKAMNEANLFGARGWAGFHRRVRQDLDLLLDDGWEVDGMATFRLNTTKFPSLGGDAEQRLHALARAVSQHGWRGTGLWCRNPLPGPSGRELLLRSAHAGIAYWKIDIGDPTFGLAEMKNQMRLPLLLEHVHGELPVNGDWQKDGRFGALSWNSPRMRIFHNTDVYRTYDVTCMLSLPTTLDRVAQFLLAAQGHPESKTLLNVEDEVYVAAVLGCTAGVMRHPLRGLRPDGDIDLFFNGPRQTKRRMDEVVRAMRWQRIARPFPPGQSYARVDATILTDSWMFRADETWQTDLVGMRVNQGAPAVIARDLPLPTVRSPGIPPFVFAGRFPNGAVAIGAQQRTTVEQAWHMPLAEVLLDMEDAPGPIGIFGHFQRLTLRMNRPLSGKRIWAQDLAGDRSFDITREVQLKNDALILSRWVIDKYGLQASTTHDLSSPGLIIHVSTG